MRVIDLGSGQDPQRFDGGQGREALAFLDRWVVVGAGGQAEREPVGGAVRDVLAQVLFQAGQGGEAVGPGALTVPPQQVILAEASRTATVVRETLVVMSALSSRMQSTGRTVLLPVSLSAPPTGYPVMRSRPVRVRCSRRAPPSAW